MHLNFLKYSGSPLPTLLASFVTSYRVLFNSSFIQESGRLYSDAVHRITRASKKCVGFIGETVIAIAKPDNSVLQNVAYNGHKRKHALKFQTATTPDGLILNAHGPTERRKHDWFMYVSSNMDEQLEASLFVDENWYCIYGDSGYNERERLEVPMQRTNLEPWQGAYNQAMSAARVTVEWMYMEVKLHSTTIDFKRKMKVLQAPVGTLYVTTLLLANFRNCLIPNTVSQYFGCKPPSIEEYICLRES